MVNVVRMVHVPCDNSNGTRSDVVVNTFLLAMGGKAPKLITTNEDASMRSVIASIFPETIHRLCMWHIMEKVPEKVGPETRKDIILVLFECLCVGFRNCR
jgi:hypothetical protein